MNVRSALGWLAIAAALAACDSTCSGSDTPAPDKPGAASDAVKRDVRAACEYRAAWKNRLKTQCSKCIGLSQAPRCGCKTDEREFSGLCASEKGKMDVEEACDAVWKCSHKCKPKDCACKAACFDGQERCQELAEAFEACTIKICEPFCG